MDCSDVRRTLSAHYDGELPLESRETVAKHLGQCDRCLPELDSFRHLSHLIRIMESNEPPTDIWEDVEDNLTNKREDAAKARQSGWHSTVRLFLGTAALLLIAVLAWRGFGVWLHSHHERQLAADFRHYVGTFQRNPSEAQQFLLARYDGKSVGLAESTAELGYLPAAAHRLPDAYTLQSTYVWDMPCCKCIQILCRRADGSMFAIFEHQEAQPAWLDQRPTVAETCGGKRCSVVQVDQQLAATWKLENRHVTVVGARDLEEVASLITSLGQAPSA